MEEGRATRPDLKIGVCGEHGGDPDSVHFFHAAGLDYVSCSPFRVPVARLEAGRARGDGDRGRQRQQVTVAADDGAVDDGGYDRLRRSALGGGAAEAR